MQPKMISITHTENGLRITASEEIGGRKSTPNYSQKSAEKLVMDIHTAVKGVSSYKGVSLNLDEIDHYDSCNEFLVPGARIEKGQRKVQDYSYMSNDIPKDWTLDVTIAFGAVKQIANPIRKTLTALGVRSVDVKEIQRMLKKNNGRAYINGTWQNGGWSSNGRYTYKVEAHDGMWD